ncbi:MAG TPA: prepilin-type N-terminal cleavage/methylation domain-containing protein [Chthoniobacteraceae bacterium]|nr:prepilin-type N-terminal cleavage/methylation domain-containing protein [Chthoniobacteraceae bacterium]
MNAAPHQSRPKAAAFPKDNGNGAGQRAFSVVELLVAIAIIAVLALLAMFSVGNLRKKARAVDCTVKLRAIGLGLAAYIQDKGYYPGVRVDPTPRNWYHGLIPYMTGERMPVNAAERARVHDWFWCKERNLNGTRTVGYGYNQYFGNIPPASSDYSPTSGFNQYWHLKPARVETPSKKIVIGDNHDAEAATSFALSVLHNGSSIDNYLRARRHNGGGNYLFADGHVEFISAVEMSERLQVDNKRILKPYVN